MFYDTVAEGYVLRIRVTPNASKCGVSGTFSDSIGAVFLKISLISVPEKGKANQELIKYLAKTLHEAKGVFLCLAEKLTAVKKFSCKQRTHLKPKKSCGKWRKCHDGAGS